MQCNICGAVPSSANREADTAPDICSGCRLRVRHRAVYSFLSAHTQVKRAIEHGRTFFCHLTPDERTFLFAGCRNFLNFDIRPMRYLDLTMDIQDMHRVPTGSVDSFVAIHVLNHVPDDKQAIDEIARILRPVYGVALLTVPVRRGGTTQANSNVTQHYGEAALKDFGVGSFRHYGFDDLTALLAPHFSVETFEFNDPIVTATEIVFCCFKRASTEPLNGV